MNRAPAAASATVPLMITDAIVEHLAAAEDALRRIHAALYALDTDRADIVADEYDAALTEVLLALDLVREHAPEAAALLTSPEQ